MIDIELIHDIEELAELQKELTKVLRGKARPSKLLEEIADVYISLDHIIKTLNIDAAKISERIRLIRGD